jgi:peptide/nickel transport system substrate-binding protein
MLKRLIILTVLLALLVATGAAQESRPDFTVAVQNNPSTMEPLRENSNVAMRIMYNVFDTLIDIDFDTFELIPGLATSWQRIDDRTLELTLREGVTFHNGDTFDAEDVAFTFGPERMFNPDQPGTGNAVTYFGTFAPVEIVDGAATATLRDGIGVQIIDDYTVRVVSTIPDPLLEQRLSMHMAQILSKQAWEEAADYDEFSRLTVGTGPYQITEVVADDYIRLEAFDAFWGGTPPLASVTFQIVPEIAARTAGLISGQYDIITEIPPDQFEIINGEDGFEVVGGPIRNNRVIVYNTTSDLLDDINLRLAMNHAIDRELIVEALYEGTTVVPLGNQFTYYGPMFIEDWQGVEYNPDLARELLEQSDYNGETIVYRLLPNYYTYQLETAEIMQQMWAEVGINVELQVMENWSQVLIFDGDEPTHISDYSTTMMYPDPVGHLWRLYGASGVWQAQIPIWQPGNPFNELGERLVVSTDLEERREIFREMMDIWQNQNPMGTYLHQLTMFYGKPTDLDWSPLVYEYMNLRPGAISVE